MVHNFYSGPAVLPHAALKRAADEFFDFAETGLSVMEVSHRSKEFDGLINEAESLLRRLMDIPKNYHVLFLPGGASLQFGMVPMNFLQPTETADFILTGGWSEKALTEATHFGKARVAFTDKSGGYRRIPQNDEIHLSDSSKYVHMTTNNTLFGTQWHYVPQTYGRPLIADMSSDIASRPIDVSQFDLIYAGAQKNLGPSGLVVVIIKDEFLKTARNDLTTMLSYKTHAENKSLYNTPNTWAIYMLRNVLSWLDEQGGLSSISELNSAKAKLIYDVIDEFPSFYKGHAEISSRSLMNITWTMLDETLEKKFLIEAEKRNLLGLKGHRSVGGMRASCYNALPLSSARYLADFMREFAKTNN